MDNQSFEVEHEMEMVTMQPLAMKFEILIPSQGSQLSCIIVLAIILCPLWSIRHTGEMIAPHLFPFCHWAN